MGEDHKNPDGKRVGETHKDSWRVSDKDRFTYSPLDININLVT